MATQATATLPTAERIELGDVGLAVHRLGDGPPVLLLHGFPELAESLAPQALALVEAGYSAILPDQRGFGGSDRPSDVAAYALDILVEDMTRLLDALGHPRAIVVGHDWGGLVMWRMAQRRPERVRACVGLSAVHWPRREREPIGMLRERFGPDHYVVRLQQPGAEAVLDADPARTADFFYRRDYTRGSDMAAAPPVVANFELLNELAAGDWRGPTLLDADERARWIAAFTRTGFTASTNWYRNVSDNWRAAEGLSDRIAAPSLMLSGQDDPFSPPAHAAVMDALFDDLTRGVVPGGHWFPQESPQATNAAILDWLAAHGAP